MKKVRLRLNFNFIVLENQSFSDILFNTKPELRSSSVNCEQNINSNGFIQLDTIRQPMFSDRENDEESQQSNANNIVCNIDFADYSNKNTTTKFREDKAKLMLNTIKSRKEYEQKVQIMNNRLSRLKRVEQEAIKKLEKLKAKIINEEKCKFYKKEVKEEISKVKLSQIEESQTNHNKIRKRKEVQRRATTKRKTQFYQQKEGLYSQTKKNKHLISELLAQVKEHEYKLKAHNVAKNKENLNKIKTEKQINEMEKEKERKRNYSYKVDHAVEEFESVKVELTRLETFEQDAINRLNTTIGKSKDFENILRTKVTKLFESEPEYKTKEKLEKMLKIPGLKKKVTNEKRSLNSSLNSINNKYLNESTKYHTIEENSNNNNKNLCHLNTKSDTKKVPNTKYKTPCSTNSVNSKFSIQYNNTNAYSVRNSTNNSQSSLNNKNNKEIANVKRGSLVSKNLLVTKTTKNSARTNSQVPVKKEKSKVKANELFYDFTDPNKVKNKTKQMDTLYNESAKLKEINNKKKAKSKPKQNKKKLSVIFDEKHSQPIKNRNKSVIVDREVSKNKSFRKSC